MDRGVYAHIRVYKSAVECTQNKFNWLLGRSVYTDFQSNLQGNMRGIQKEILKIAVYATEDPSLLPDKKSFTGLFCPFTSTRSPTFPSSRK